MVSSQMILESRLWKPCELILFTRCSWAEKDAVWENFPALNHFNPERHIHTTSLILHCCCCCCCCQVASVVSNSVKPQRRQPTRLPHPWDSPGKNTGAGCHFLLQCMILHWPVLIIGLNLNAMELLALWAARERDQ